MKPLETWKDQHICNPTQTHQTSQHQMTSNEAVLEASHKIPPIENQPDEVHTMAHQHAHELSTGDKVV